MNGIISFVGAGPGAPDLLTLRGAARLARAEIVIWPSSLVPQAVLSHASPGATVIDSATMTLEDVIEVYSNNPGARIVRLASGDPTIYGALQEQIDWCVARQRDFEIVPGVSSFTAAAALCERELTQPGISQSIVLTRLPGRTAASVPAGESLERFAAAGSTMAIFLAGARPAELVERLLAPDSAFTPATPAAVVAYVTWEGREKLVVTDISGIETAVAGIGTSTTVLVLVGDFMRDGAGRSRLYAPDFNHKYRYRSASPSTKGRPSAAAKRRPDRLPRSE